ncbi:MAG: hypothetical protein WC371_04625 [Parachlamydiales bacterium]
MPALVFCAVFTSLDSSYANFLPPPGFELADPRKLPEKVQAGLIEKSLQTVRPSLNLIEEKTPLSLNEYLESFEKSYLEKKYVCHRLGPLPCKAGEGRLLQVDLKGFGEDMRLWQFFFFKDQIIYVLTAASAKSKSQNYYPGFLKTFQSFELLDDLFLPLSASRKSQLLQKLKDLLKTRKPKNFFKLEKYLKNNFADLGPYWQWQVVQAELKKHPSKT